MSYLTDPFKVPDATPRPTAAAEAAPDAASPPEPGGRPAVTDEPTGTPAGGDDDAPPAPAQRLDAPADGVPPVVEDERRLVEAALALAAGTGPLAVDAERASGYRYGQRAYLVQLRRQGSGTWLVDPVACPDLAPIGEATAGVEWVLHAATQDLPCLREVGLRPAALFDTELGARLAGLPRVGLAAVVEHYLGYALAKEHSAVDWSTRPLPEPWLRYAALDVELLVELRHALSDDLQAQGKLGWAQQEFAALTAFEGPPVRVDPWRRTSGMHRVRTRRTAALVRELWYTRDDLARDRDVSPGRVLPDSALLELASAAPRTGADISAATAHKSARRHQSAWLAAVERVLALPEAKLPPTTVPADGPPPQRTWGDRDPVAAARLAAVRAELTAFAAEHAVPVENLVSPDMLRRLVWTPPADRSPAALSDALLARGARAWQAQIVAPCLARALDAHPGAAGGL